MAKLNPKKMAKAVSGAFIETLKGERVNNSEPQAPSGEISPGQSIDLRSVEEKATALEKRYFKKFYHQAEHLHAQEKNIQNSKGLEVNAQIKSLQEELIAITKATKELEKEVEVAVFQTPIEAGVYHVAFFEKLRHFIKAFRLKIDNSSSWLATFNQRSKKKSHYWSQVEKSGSKFTDSSERTIATQVG